METKTFDPDEFLLDLYAMSRDEVQKMFDDELSNGDVNLEKIEVMIKSGLVDIQNFYMYSGCISPLHWACEQNLPKIVKLLIEKGADIEDTEVHADGMSPLHIASKFNLTECAKLLLEAGADPMGLTCWEYTPLHFACDSSSYDVAKLLLEAGADPEAENEQGETPFQWTKGDKKMRDLLKKYLE